MTTLEPDAADLAEGRRSFWLLFPVVSLAMFVSFGDNTIVATALPALAAEFGEPTRAPLIISAYLVAMMVAAPVFGRLGDAFGHKPMLRPAAGLFIAASGLCTLAPEFWALVAFRSAQGIGAGGLVALASALLAERILPRQRAGYQGYIATFVVGSYATGPILSGLLTEFADWRAIFLLNIRLDWLFCGLPGAYLTGTCRERRFNSISRASSCWRSSSVHSWQFPRRAHAILGSPPHWAVPPLWR